MGSNGRILRVLFGAVVFFGVIWVLFLGILANHATTETMTTTRTTTTVTVKVPSTENFKQWKLIAREKNQHHTHQDSDLNYVSKRRVPNGPDPIHNRRASKARQPPGRI
ncbi:hypothetical protein Ddye_015092 [Dipteronia dyeriana]|uniref:CLAVATA3/ESR (CLE)-related protein 25 n=1 Tax=Dipteronia dyeriana TaxID=168575 RepID=A0AAD9U4Y4_9ROSI|nr:hypothetical protein Ddye_015092 [Dipteronia dyeriana]